MANTTSGTATFDKTFAIDEIVEDAFERILDYKMLQVINLKSARRSLKYIYFKNGVIEVFTIGK